MSLVYQNSNIYIFSQPFSLSNLGWCSQGPTQDNLLIKALLSLSPHFRTPYLKDVFNVHLFNSMSLSRGKSCRRQYNYYSFLIIYSCSLLPQETMRMKKWIFIASEKDTLTKWVKCKIVMTILMLEQPDLDVTRMKSEIPTLLLSVRNIWYHSFSASLCSLVFILVPFSFRHSSTQSL